MAITQLYTAVPGDVITAARWNNEFGNIYNNLVPLLNNYDALNLKDDYAAIGDGTTSDQSAVASAVAAALSAGKDLYWPAGTYKTTASIASFHSVRHRGPGILKRGSDLFYVDPSLNSGATNNLYIATTGSNTNDGFSTAEPRLTVQSMGDVLYGYTYGDVTWKINLAAGTYSSTLTYFSKSFPTPNTVQFLGATVSAGVQPTTIVQAATPTTDTVGFYFQGDVLAQVSNINFKSFRAAGAPSSLTLGSGVIADANSILYTVNVWTDDCDQGVFVTNGSQLRMQSGRHGFNAVNGCGTQILRHSHAVIGYGGSAADVTGATGVAFIGGNTGVILQEFGMTHTDFCYFNACTTGVALSYVSRLHSVSSTYLSCTTGIDARLNSIVGDTTNTFTTCTTDVVLRGGSRNANVELLPLGPPVTDTSVVLASSSNTVSPGDTFYTTTFNAKEFQPRGTGFRLRIFFSTTTNAGTKTVLIKLGSTTLLTGVIAAATGFAVVELELITVTAASSQLLVTRIYENGVTPQISVTNTTMDLTASLTLTCSHFVANGADTSRIRGTMIDTQH